MDSQRPMFFDLRRRVGRQWRHLRAASGTGPRIVFVTTPKSGTLFLHNNFLGSLGFRHLQASPGYFPHDYLDDWRLRKQRPGWTVSSTHLAPGLANLRLLRHHFGRWQLHLRDPRSVTLSWTHHVMSYARAGDMSRHLVRVCWDGPEDEEFLDWEFDRLLDWNIRNFLPRVVSWQTGWLKLQEASRGEVLLTTYADLLAGPDEFLARSARFFGVDPERVVAFSKSNVNRHFRTGRADEWKDVFTDRQKAHCDELIPRELAEFTNRPTAAA